MFVTKSDAAVLYGAGIMAYIVVGTMWILWRLGSSWFGYGPLTAVEDIRLVAVSALGLAILGFLVFGCLALGRYLDRKRLISADNRVWDVAFIIGLAIWIGLRMVILRLEAKGLAEGFHSASITSGPAAAATIGCVAALVLWFKGTRGVALLMVLYVVLFAAWLGGWVSPLLSWLGAQ